jgi:hypothetical protein
MLIAFTGPKHSGKTECADFLVRKYGHRKINFKDALIAELCDKFPNLIKEIKAHYPGTTNIWKSKPPMIRYLLQEYGTNVRREDDYCYWTARWHKEYDRVYNKVTHNIVVDDVRFENEASIVRMSGGKIIRIERETDQPVDNHPSETEMKKIKPHHVIVNDTTLENLFLSLDSLYNHISS